MLKIILYLVKFLLKIFFVLNIYKLCFFNYRVKLVLIMFIGIFLKLKNIFFFSYRILILKLI